jgi:hypothetical protein
VKGEKIMGAITNLVATVALLLAMIAAGDATTGQVKVSSKPATHSISSRPLTGCEEFGCGTNHNETLMRDAAPMK